MLRVPLGPFRTASTKVGRRYCRLEEGDRVVLVELVRDATTLFLRQPAGTHSHFPISEINVLSGAGKGVIGIKLADDDASSAPPR